MKRERALIKNTIIMSIGTFLPKIATLITLPIVTAELTQKEYGTYDLIITLVSFFLPMVTLQIQAAGFRFLIDYRGDDKKIKSIITNIFVFIIPVSVISLLFLFLALSKLPITLRLLICIYFFLDILVMTARQLVRGLAKNMLYSVSAVVDSAMNMILIIGILKMSKQGINGLLFSLILATLSGLLILVLKGNLIGQIDFHMTSCAQIKKMIGYSWPLVPNVLSDWVLRLSDRMVITIFIGLDATAVYAIANKIPALLTLVQNTFTYAWQENASLASKDEDEDAYYTYIFDIISRILTGSTALLIAVTPILFQLLIRGNYQEAYDQMPILFLGMLFSMVSSFIGGIYIAHKRTVNMGVTTLAAALANLMIDLLLVKHIGIYAASLSTLISYFILSIYRMHDVLKFHEIKYNICNLLFYLLFLMIMCILCWLDTGYSNLFNGLLGITFAVAINRNILKSILIQLKRFC